MQSDDRDKCKYHKKYEEIYAEKYDIHSCKKWRIKDFWKNIFILF